MYTTCDKIRTIPTTIVPLNIYIYIYIYMCVINGQITEVRDQKKPLTYLGQSFFGYKPISIIFNKANIDNKNIKLAETNIHMYIGQAALKVLCPICRPNK